jgi:hypothetical protein
MIVKTAPWLLRGYMKACGFQGWTSFWRTVYVLPGYETSARLLRHEACHLEQIEREGRWRFALKYGWYWLRHGYRDNPYEIEARRAEWD